MVVRRRRKPTSLRPRGSVSARGVAAAPRADRVASAGAEPVAGPELGEVGRYAPVDSGGGVRPGHPLADMRGNERLHAFEQGFRDRFAELVPVLREIHAMQHEKDFAERAQSVAEGRLGIRLPEQVLEDAWINHLDTRRLYLEGSFRLFDRMVNEYWAGRDDLVAEAEAAIAWFLDCDFHEVDISPCSDGRLLGLRRFILRLPDMAVRVKSYAGALFDIEEDVRHWTKRELMRFREGRPTTADVPSRYLKVAAYHYSSADPDHQGCTAHASCEREAADAALRQLRAFRQAVENTYCCGASVDTLLIGVDTDTDAIKVHVPDAETRMSLYRFVDSAALYRETQHMNEQDASLALYRAIQDTVHQQGWGTGNGAPHEGMLRFISRLLMNNLSQLDYVARYHGGHYADVGHRERMIIVGQEVEEMQVRNFAYIAHLDTMEEGAESMDVGVNKVFRKLNVERGLPVPVVVHFRYDRKVPGSRERVEARCRRVRDEIMRRYRDLAEKGLIGCHMVIRDKRSGSQLEPLEA
ncbi:carboxysome shell carbonic anhydrase [Thioalkalivibrio sp. ALJ24]|uniref:carboxysome shell carbonic anhydrase n=1 Tax=Thioalkalivibrio sp. ALJ24 TaxID=545276 RepID=UPI00210096E5|nr:carboxysome shell carbonic anhydrase [Thioalkalivibrio sp. ALJ24]